MTCSLLHLNKVLPIQEGLWQYKLFPRFQRVFYFQQSQILVPVEWYLPPAVQTLLPRTDFRILCFGKSIIF